MPIHFRRTDLTNLPSSIVDHPLVGLVLEFFSMFVDKGSMTETIFTRAEVAADIEECIERFEQAMHADDSPKPRPMPQEGDAPEALSLWRHRLLINLVGDRSMGPLLGERMALRSGRRVDQLGMLAAIGLRTCEFVAELIEEGSARVAVELTSEAHRLLDESHAISRESWASWQRSEHGRTLARQRHVEDYELKDKAREWYRERRVAMTKDAAAEAMSNCPTFPRSFRTIRSWLTRV